MIELREVVETTNGDVLRPLFVNPKHIVSFRTDERQSQVLKENKVIGKNESVVKIYLDIGASGQVHYVVGSVQKIREQLQKGKQLLNG